MAGAPLSVFSRASEAASRRRIAARVNRLLREVDKHEDLVVRQVLAALAGAQGRVRAVVGEFGGRRGGYLALVEQLRPIWSGAQQSLAELVLHGVIDAGALGGRMLDDILELAELTAPLPPLRVEAFLDEVGQIRTRVLVADTVEVSVRAGRLEALRLTAGQQDLEATLRAIGTRPEGSRVFGRAAERLEGVTRAELGEAHSTVAQGRAEQAAEHVPGLRKRWISSHRARSRESHAAVEARYPAGIPVDEKFRVGRFEAHGPRMPGLPGAERFHCRCRVVVIPPEEQEES